MDLQSDIKVIILFFFIGIKSDLLKFEYEPETNDLCFVQERG